MYMKINFLFQLVVKEQIIYGKIIVVLNVIANQILKITQKKLMFHVFFHPISPNIAKPKSKVSDKTLKLPSKRLIPLVFYTSPDILLNHNFSKKKTYTAGYQFWSYKDRETLLFRMTLCKRYPQQLVTQKCRGIYYRLKGYNRQ